jgi:hypothetical protein
MTRTPSQEDLTNAIETAAERAISALFHEHPEHFYYCSLITTGEAHAPTLTAWSEEALHREAAKPASERGRWATPEREGLRWSYGESPYFCYGEECFVEVERLFAERPPMDCNADDYQWIKEYDLRIGCMEEAMRRLDKKGIFGEGEKRKRILINVEVMSPDYRNTERTLRLNPGDSAILAEWLATCAEPLPESKQPSPYAEWEMGRGTSVPCKRCGREGMARLAQAIVFKQLRWHQATSCTGCGYVEEEDGIGFPPQQLRDRILRDAGRWKLLASGLDRARAIKVVRSVLGLTGEAASAFRQFPVLYIGTRTEADWLKTHMGAAGARRGA